MTRSLQSLLEDIELAPSGPQVAALFDLDRTLINGFSVQDVFLERILNRDMGAREIARTVRDIASYKSGRISFSEFVANMAKDLAGKSDAETMGFGYEVFARRIAQRIYPESRQLVEAHRAKGHTLVVVSSATRYQVEPVAHDLGIYHQLCTQLEIINGVCSGKIVEPPCYGPGKLSAASALGVDVGFSLDDSFFYSDGFEDVPLLEAVGNPCALNPDAKLTRHAHRTGWPTARFDSRKRPGFEEVLRTSLAYASLSAAGGLAIADFVLNRDIQHARNVAGTVWGELATAALDLRVDVTGEDHLWSQRPAVFVFNHQSQLDAIIMARLLRQDFTGIAKKEVKSQLFVGQMFQAAGVIFIDRADRTKAIAAMRPAVDALRSGTSIVIAPEGTRSPTRALQPFKKGAFHLAMQAGVPMVPVVLHNTSDFMPKGTVFAHRGVVEVEVLEPIDTSAWRRETLNQHVEGVRQRFLEALGQS